jgi:opacity protein-like surface antigen
VIGAGANALQGSCQFCEVESPPAKHTWTLFTDLGVRINEKMSAGAEISWVPAEASDGTPIRTTFLVGVAQFHPWKSSGFFVKGGAGVALIRNWVLEFDAPTLQKALAVHIGAGWIFQVTKRLKVELYGAQHAAALGDFETPQGTATNVMGNYWSAGAAVVIK